MLDSAMLQVPDCSSVQTVALVVCFCLLNSRANNLLRTGNDV